MARNDGEVLLVLLPLHVGRGLFVAVHDRVDHAVPLHVPVGLPAVDGDVVHAHLLFAHAEHDAVARLLRHVLPGSVGIHAQVVRDCANDLRIVIPGRKRRDSAFIERKRRVRHHEGGIDLFPAADAQAVWTCSVRCIEGKVARLQLVHRMPVLRAGQRKRVEVLVVRQAARSARARFLRSVVGRRRLCAAFPSRRTVDRLHEHAAVGQLRRRLHRLRNARRRVLFQDDAVDDHVDEVLDLLVEHERFAFEAQHLTVDAHAREALLLQILEQLRELALAPDHDRSHDERTNAFAQSQDLIRDLVGRLFFDLASALRTMRRAHAGEEQAQVVVDFRGGAHGRARVFARGLLIDGHGRRKTVDTVQVGLVHLAQKLARVAGEALHIAALPFRVHRVEGKARLARSGQAGNDDQLVARDGHVDVFQVVLAGAFDDDSVLCHNCVLFLRRSFLQHLIIAEEKPLEQTCALRHRICAFCSPSQERAHKGGRLASPRKRAVGCFWRIPRKWRAVRHVR